MPEYPRFPRSALGWSKTEHTSVALDATEGSIPKDLEGTYYFMTPAANASRAAEGRSSADWPDRGSVINGDGMVVKIEFASGRATLTSRFVKTLDFWADELTANDPKWRWAKFDDFGILRMSLVLGARNPANTALLPARFGQGPQRLLCCYDAGPAVEIDPVTLATFGTLGGASAWTPEALPHLPFPPILSTAHPFYDAHTNEVWTVNYGRSFMSMLAAHPRGSSLVGHLRANIVRALTPAATWLADALDAPTTWFRDAMRGVLRRTLGADGEQRLKALLTATEKVPVLGNGSDEIPSDFLHLLRWSGGGTLDKVKLVDSVTGKPLMVEQSLHQIAVTRHWIILMDTCFDLWIEQFYSDPLPKDPAIDRLIRDLTARPQLDASSVWFVRRDDVAAALNSGGSGTAKAMHVRLPLGAVHFLSDYEDVDERGNPLITMHVGHGVSLDIAEWIRAFDLLRTVKDPNAVVELQGMIASAVDQSRIGRWQIDPVQGAIVSSDLIQDDKTWGIALYAGHQVPNWGRPTERFDEVFWFTSGLWPELMSKFIWRMYEHQPDRVVAMERVDGLLRSGGTPSYLLRVKTNPLHVADSFAYPEGTTPSSPQLAPSSQPSHPGYLLTTVWTDTGSEVWVFDAGNLAAGPTTKLTNRMVRFGFSMHACWIPAENAHRGADPARKAERVAQHAAWQSELEQDIAARVAGNQRLRGLMHAVIEKARGMQTSSKGPPAGGCG